MKPVVFRGTAAKSRIAAEAAAVSETALALAVLLQAGLTPRSAWSAVAHRDPLGPASSVAAAHASGVALPEAIARQGGPWTDLAAVWRVASLVGAPLADTLRSFAAGQRDAVDAVRDVEVALAEPAGTARLMGLLPLAGFVFGVVLGFDPFSAIVQPVGGACIALGLVLMLAARTWTRALVRAAQPPPGLPGIEAELCAVALAGGVSVDRALALVEEARAVRIPPHGVVRDVLALSRSAGAPAGELLRAEAAAARRAASTEGRMRAVRLSQRLLMPLGVCTLPAFLLIGVAPLLVAILASSELPLP